MNASSPIYRKHIKPVLDRLVAALMFIILLPVFILLTILLSVANNGMPFFLQFRPGKNERIFRVIKFKTMNDRKDAHGNLLPDEVRLSALGRFVRKTSLDEIPQLLNVITGEMSLVGPRPLLVDYLPLYDEYQRRRHEVRPGITGWAQVNGRNSVGWPERFHFDIWYVDNCSFMLDVKILFMTIFKVFRSEGISAKGHATMPTFIDFVKSNQRT